MNTFPPFPINDTTSAYTFAKSLTSIIGASHQIKSKSKSQWNRASVIIFYPNILVMRNGMLRTKRGCRAVVVPIPNEFAEHVIDTIRSVKVLFDLNIYHDQNAKCW